MQQVQIDTASGTQDKHVNVYRESVYCAEAHDTIKGAYPTLVRNPTSLYTAIHICDYACNFKFFPSFEKLVAFW